MHHSSEEYFLVLIGRHIFNYLLNWTEVAYQLASVVYMSVQHKASKQRNRIFTEISTILLH